jgi:hypothetical protein
MTVCPAQESGLDELRNRLCYFRLSRYLSFLQPACPVRSPMLSTSTPITLGSQAMGTTLPKTPPEKVLRGCLLTQWLERVPLPLPHGHSTTQWPGLLALPGQISSSLGIWRYNISPVPYHITASAQPERQKRRRSSLLPPGSASPMSYSPQTVADGLCSIWGRPWAGESD